MPSRLLALLAFVFCSSCVTYDFEPVEPAAISQVITVTNVQPRQDKPLLFMVVDKSGSMSFGVDSPGCSCPNGSCPAGCPTRWTELQSAMGSFLSNQGSVAHLGMVPFPRDGVCGGAVLSDIASLGVELDQSLETDDVGMQQTATAIKNRLDAIVPQGGTPTSASLDSLVDYTALVGGTVTQGRYVLLLTDGLPNCNAANDPIAATCSCTFSKPAGGTCTTAGSNLCLDDSASVAAIRRLKAVGVGTIVLGFGAETNTGLGPQTLEALAAAGGFKRQCTSDADCGSGDSCSVQTVDPCGKATLACSRSFYQAGNAAELGRTLNAIRDGISCGTPCSYVLTSRPSDPLLVSATLDDVAPPRSDWTYDALTNTVVFQGATCDRLKNATPSSPVKLAFRVVQTF